MKGKGKKRTEHWVGQPIITINIKGDFEKEEE